MIEKKPKYVLDVCWLEKEERMFLVSDKEDFIICTRCGYRQKRKPNERVVEEFKLNDGIIPDLEYNEYASEYLKQLKGDKK